MNPNLTSPHAILRSWLFLACAASALAAVPTRTSSDIAAGDAVDPLRRAAQQAASRGTIEGRVSNPATGDFLERAAAPTSATLSSI
jgi:hypothetical protein